MSIISFFGSKSSNNFIEFINTKIPKKDIKTYLEPFGGSFATYMDDESLNFETVIYNDKNRHQVNLLKCCSEPEKFLPYLKYMKEKLLYIDEKDPLKKWEFYKSIYKKYTKNECLDAINFEIGDFKKASIYAFLITSSHNSCYPGKGAGFNGYKKSHDKLKLEILINKLEKNKYTNKLKSISEFYNIDFEELIKKYDDKNTYIYLDPPYFDPNNKRLGWYGSKDKSVFGKESHERLANLIKNCKSRWALSYYDFPQLSEWFPKDKFIWNEKEFNRPSARGGNNAKLKSKDQSKGKELLIMNYDPETGIKI